MITPHRQVMLDSDTVAGLAAAVAETQAVRCVEVGTYLATGSTVILGGLMAAASGQLWCVDPCNCDIATLQQDPSINGDHFDLLLRNISALRLDSIIHVIRKTSRDAAVSFRDESVCLVYIDGDHSESGVRSDLLHWAPKVRPGGIICGDDWYDGNGVVAAVLAMLPGYRRRGRFWWAIR